MTMFTNNSVEDGNNSEEQSFDFLSFEYQSVVTTGDSQIDHTIPSCSKTMASNIYNTNIASANGHIDSNGGKKDNNKEDETSLHLQFDELDESNATCVNIEGTKVLCRGRPVNVAKVFRKDEDGDTLLHIALILLSPELAFYIIDRSPSFDWLNIKNKLSQAPLHLAVLTNQIPLVRRLVVAGADIESRDEDGNMPIHLACRDNLVNAVRALLDPVSPDEQKRNNYEIPYQMIPQDLNSKNYEGVSCLHLAAKENNIEIIKVLLDYSADVNVKAEKSGKTILHEAAWSGNVKLVKFLISLGRQCDINAKTYDDYTPFDLARSRGHWSIVMELATAGARYEDEKDLELQ